MKMWRPGLVVVCQLLTSCGSKPDGSSTEDPITVLASHKVVDEFQINGPRDLEGIGRALFAHPKSQFALPVSNGHSVDFQFGIVDTATVASPPTEGVEFRVLLADDPAKTSVLWSRQLRPTAVAADRGTQKGTASIPAGTKQLVFETLPVGAPQNNWAYWTGVSLR